MTQSQKQAIIEFDTNTFVDEGITYKLAENMAKYKITYGNHYRGKGYIHLSEYEAHAYLLICLESGQSMFSKDMKAIEKENLDFVEWHYNRYGFPPTVPTKIMRENSYKGFWKFSD